MRPTEAIAIVVLLVQAPSRNAAAWSTETQELFGRMLEDLDGAATERAVLAWIKTHRDRPTIADIREAVRAELVTARALPGELEADEAWGLVVRSFTDVGRYREFPLTYLLVAEVVARMGWETLCDSDNPEADRAHFLKLYAAALGRAREERLAAPALRLPADAERLRLSTTAPAKTIADQRSLTPALALVNIREILATLPLSQDSVPGVVSDQAEPATVADLAVIRQRKVQREKLREQADALKASGT